MPEIRFTDDEFTLVQRIVGDLEPTAHELTRNQIAAQEDAEAAAAGVRREVRGAVLMGMMARAMAASIHEHGLTESDVEATTDVILDLDVWTFDMRTTPFLSNPTDTLQRRTMMLCDLARDLAFDSLDEELELLIRAETATDDL